MMKKLANYIKRNKGEAGPIGNVKPHLDVISVARLEEYFEKNPVHDWIPVTKQLPKPEDFEVTGYSKEWIHEDYNPRGIRSCFINGDGTDWVSAKWCNSQDYWHGDDESAPTHWKYIDEPPK